MKDYRKLQNGSDIRGVAMEGIPGETVSLTEAAVSDLAYAFASWLSGKTNKKTEELIIAVGTDSRLTAKSIAEICITALSYTGAKVIDAGMASTPAMYMATQFPETNCDGSIMITASHLPYNRNGLKFFTKESGLEKSDIKDLITIAESLDESYVEKKENIRSFDLIDIYSAHLRKLITDALGEGKALSGLKVAVDAGNGAGGFYAAKVLEPLGADISGSQYLEPDGNFPNHQPNPENKEAMDSISKAVLASKSDLGIIFDTDVDRSAAVDHTGREISRNGIVALAASLVAEDFPGSTVVTDSITSTQLKDFLENKLGMKHFRYQRGYRNVINKGLEIADCHLAIETSGHAAIKENYWLDDGSYLATKIIIKAKKLKDEGKYIDEVLKDLKDPLEAKEIRIKVKAENFAQYAQKVLDEFSLEDGWSLETPNYEGIRVNTSDGWFLLRKSLHDPILPLNIESDKDGGVMRMEQAIRNKLAKYDQLEF